FVRGSGQMGVYLQLRMTAGRGEGLPFEPIPQTRRHLQDPLGLRSESLQLADHEVHGVAGKMPVRDLTQLPGPGLSLRLPRVAPLALLPRRATGASRDSLRCASVVGIPFAALRLPRVAPLALLPRRATGASRDSLRCASVVGIPFAALRLPPQQALLVQ